MQSQTHLPLRSAISASLLAVCSTSFAVTITDLSSLGELSVPTAINNLGQVTGYSVTFTPNSRTHPFLYSSGTLTELPFVANDINDAGQIVGGVTTADRAGQATLYSNGTTTVLGPGQATAINDAGQIAGSRFVKNTIGGAVYRAVLYSKGATTDLLPSPTEPDLPPTNTATDINNMGQVVGSNGSTSVHSPGSGPYLYNNGAVIGLGSLGGFRGGASAINDAGQVTGSSEVKSPEFTRFESGPFHAFLYSNGTMTDLGTLGGRISAGNDINKAGQIVGSASISDPLEPTHAFLYSNGVMINLNSLLPAGTGWTLTDATGINDNGQIVGMGLLDGDGRNHAYLLSDLPPVPLPASWVMLLSGLVAIGAIGASARRRSGDNIGAAISV